MLSLPLLQPLRGRPGLGALLSSSRRGVASGWPASFHSCSILTTTTTNSHLISRCLNPSRYHLGLIPTCPTTSLLQQRLISTSRATLLRRGVSASFAESRRTPLSASTSRSLSSKAVEGSSASSTSSQTAVPTQAQATSSTYPLSLLTSRYPSTRPYLSLARLDKPIGTWLLFLPCAFSLTLSAQLAHLPPSTLLWNLGLFGTGALVMRGAGCTINDLWDRELDKGVERTMGRPLASGELTVKQALVFLAGQLTAGLGVLVCLNKESIILGAASLFVVAVYPLMKRITYWPQLVLGLAFNWGALLGPMALTASLQPSLSLPLYSGCIAWTLLYDTIYAHQDKVDDVGAGIKSTALLFGDRTKSFLTGFGATFVTSTLVAASGVFGSLSVQSALEELAVHHAGLCLASLAASAHVWWQIFSLDQDDRASCWAKFVANRHLGFLLWGGMSLDYFWAWLAGFA